jgi:hypothetical protein
VSAWFRAGHDRHATGAIHVNGCTHMRNSKQWDLVSGWPKARVVDHIASVPWLRLCHFCADRLGLPPEHPARHSSDGKRDYGRSSDVA